MKWFAVLLIICSACDSNSSPEGRMTNKMEDIRKEFDSMKQQNAMILDSLGKISEQLRKMNEKEMQ